MVAQTPELIFCADGNLKHARIALASGWSYGVRLPGRGMLADAPLALADQDWRRPDRQRYMACLAQHRPRLAVVLDWEREEQLPEVLSWADEAAQYAQEAVLIVPKVPGGVPLLPQRIGSKDVRLGYSVPTSHGASPLGLWEFAGWPVHLLGGSPQRQYEVWQYLHLIASVPSLDGNMAKRMATQRCCYWTRGTTRHGHWQPLNRAVENDAPDECLSRSLRNVAQAWEYWRSRVTEVPSV